MDIESFVRGLPKAELHLHIEGTLEPELMFELARRNRRTIRFESVEALRAAYRFEDLQSFLDIYYEGARVLITEQDFSDLTWAYLLRAHADGVRHAEIFFDPQTHTARGISMATVVEGIGRALDRARRELGMTSGLILCFLRHASPEEAMETLEEALPFRDRIVGLGLDSSERGHPPGQFEPVFARGRALGFHVVAHAGEEGPPDYVWQALDLLKAERIDHGVRAIEDDALLARLATEQIPLTTCPLSNVALKVYERMEDHPLKRLVEAGLCVTVSSDDPAYFGGYVADNYLAVHRALGLGREDLTRLAAASFEASFLDAPTKAAYRDELRAYASRALLEDQSRV